jgi:hypothetical protein
MGRDRKRVYGGNFNELIANASHTERNFTPYRVKKISMLIVAHLSHIPYTVKYHANDISFRPLIHHCRC